MAFAPPVSILGQVLEAGKVFNFDVFHPARISSVSLDETAKPGSVSIVKVKFVEADVGTTYEDSDDEDEQDQVQKAAEKEIVLAHLREGVHDFQTLDFNLPVGQTFTFTVTGQNKVHMLGQFLDYPDENDYGSDSDMSDESGSEDEMMETDSEDEDVSEDDEDESEDEDRIQEIEEDATEEQPAKAKSQAVKGPPPSVLPEKILTADGEEIDRSSLSKTQRKRLSKRLRKEAEQAAQGGEDEQPAAKANGTKSEKEKEKKRPAESPATTQQKKPSDKIVHPSGLVIEDKKQGNGPTAQAGKKVSMRYIGRFQNGKIFDSNLKGKPLNFTLGKGQVIKGWEEGLKGMSLGSERRLTIPPALAYGKRGVDGIPGNSTLVFDVKLLSVK